MFFSNWQNQAKMLFFWNKTKQQGLLRPTGGGGVALLSNLRQSQRPFRLRFSFVHLLFPRWSGAFQPVPFVAPPHVARYDWLTLTLTLTLTTDWTKPFCDCPLILWTSSCPTFFGLFTITWLSNELWVCCQTQVNWSRSQIGTIHKNRIQTMWIIWYTQNRDTILFPSFAMTTTTNP